MPSLPGNQKLPRIEVDLANQLLILIPGGHSAPFRYSVSTAVNGPGEQQDSGCTPRGQHYIRAMVGRGLPAGTVFVGRRPTGEDYSTALAEAFPHRDWILSRILWLCGCEAGKNRGKGVDSFRRFIYIHGTPDTEPMGVPGSHGCIRMRNRDVIDLFERVTPGTPVSIA